MQYRTLPAATWTHESDSLPRLYVKVDPVENWDLGPRRVTEYDIRHFDVSTNVLEA